jgi:UDP-N-acetylglucosamine--N-acetylmuramyl-(pentapeptide) pyrophosphoryl-undecaprenol N-acetylglucosamine transferase
MTERAGRTIVFAGGGSGGHLTPGLALAEALADIAPNHRALFACSTRQIDADILSAAGATTHPIEAFPPALHPVRLLRFVRAHRRAVREAATMLRAENACLVIALGGFVAVPVVTAAHRLGIPTILMNLDDPPGKANRWIARRCTHIWSAVPVHSSPEFAERIVGMPVRRNALAPASSADCKAQLGLDPSRHVLLITGASQGATSINDFIVRFAEQHGDALANWQILHLAGPGREDDVRAAYADLSLEASPVVRAYLHDMGLAWGAADAALSRAGASSVAEVAANAVPTMFFPYPYHRDQHQARNAASLVEAGAAICVRDHVEVGRNLEAHAEALVHLLTDDAYRTRMRGTLDERRPSRPAADSVAQSIHLIISNM